MRSCTAPATSGTPGVDPDTGAGILNVAQAAALLAGADHAGPHVSMHARWSQDASHPGIVLSGRAQERGGGTSTGITAAAFLSLRGVPKAPFVGALGDSGRRERRDARGLLGPSEVRRLSDGRHKLWVRARDATGNWGPVRMVVLPVDRVAPRMQASGSRNGSGVSTILHVHDPGSGTALLRYRVEIGGRLGAWHAIAPAARIRLALHVPPGTRAILRVRATDLVGNETRAGFVLPA